MVNSPCVRNCCLDQQDCCLGCGRSLAEIIEWHQADDVRRLQILQQAAVRLSAQATPDAVKRRVVNPSE